MAEAHTTLPSFYTERQWRDAALLFLTCALVQLGASKLFPVETLLLPGMAVALAGLFFGGVRLWPAVLLGFLAARFVEHTSLPIVYVLPIAATATAAAGATLLRKAGIDPLFRRFRDTFYLITVSLLISVIPPTLFMLVPEQLLAGARWSYGYIASLCALLVVAPFLLRWIAKPSFRRPLSESLETLSIFTLLIVIDTALFVYHITDIGGIFLIYILLIPFFWIAIRLRPRFVSLAVLITAGFALSSVLTGTDPLLPELFDAELFLIALSMAFYIIVSTEEERRVSTNLLRSQLATLENAVSRISTENQAKNDFIAILAHELRNPLAPIASAIELMKVQGVKSPADGETLAIMETSMQTVRRLLDDLLDTSRIVEGKIALKTKVTDFGQVLRRAIGATAHHYRDRHQPLEISWGKEPYYVLGDPVRLEQVFSNLLTNASKYSDSGDTVTLSLRRDGDTVEVALADEGIGIASDALGTVFLPFHQLESGKRSKKGLGIGLALVHAFVEMHNGSVRAMSEGIGKGSTFIVRLPLTKKLPEAKTSSPRARKSRTGGFSVLIVDDNDAAAAGIGKLLELEGSRVSYAYTAAQGIEAVAASAPDIILLDIGLPDQDGYTAAKRLRAEGYAGFLVALSGYSTPEAKEQAMAAGFDRYLVKPTGLTELRRIIEEAGRQG